MNWNFILLVASVLSHSANGALPEMGSRFGETFTPVQVGDNDSVSLDISKRNYDRAAMNRMLDNRHEEDFSTGDSSKSVESSGSSEIDTFKTPSLISKAKSLIKESIKPKNVAKFAVGTAIVGGCYCIAYPDSEVAQFAYMCGEALMGLFDHMQGCLNSLWGSTTEARQVVTEYTSSVGLGASYQINPYEISQILYEGMSNGECDC